MLHKCSTHAPKMLQNRPQDASGALLNPMSFLDAFLERFWFPFGLQFGSLLASISESILCSFSSTLRERPRKAFGRISARFGVRFGSLFRSFWKTPGNGKNYQKPIVKHHFSRFQGLRQTSFFPPCFRRRLRDSVWEPFGLPLGRFWVEFGSPVGRLLGLFSRFKSQWIPELFRALCLWRLPGAVGLPPYPPYPRTR